MNARYVKLPLADAATISHAVRAGAARGDVVFWRAEDTRLSLERDGADWPNRQASALIEAHGLRWHVQSMGEGPGLLLLHGTGASTHSWRGLAPLSRAPLSRRRARSSRPRLHVVARRRDAIAAGDGARGRGIARQDRICAAGRRRPLRRRRRCRRGCASTPPSRPSSSFPSTARWSPSAAPAAMSFQPSPSSSFSIP